MIPQLDVPSGLLEGSEVGEARQTDFFDGRANKIRTLQPKKTSTALHHGMRLRDVEEDALPGLRSGGGYVVSIWLGEPFLARRIGLHQARTWALRVFTRSAIWRVGLRHHRGLNRERKLREEARGPLP